MSTAFDQERPAPAGLERLTAVLGWWLGPDAPPTTAGPDLGRLREVALQVQEVMCDSSSSQLDCCVVTNRRLARALARLAQTPTLGSLMARQAEIATILMEATASQLRTLADAADRTHRCCAPLVDEPSAEAEAASADAAQTGRASGPARPVPPRPAAMQAATYTAGGANEGRP